MLVVERYRPAPTVLDADRTPLARALGIGACQVLALIPGVSRSGATIVGGMVLGLDRAAAAEFSFFLAMPTMMAAFAHSLLKVRHHLAPERALEIAIGFVMAFIASALVVKPFLRRPAGRVRAVRLVPHRGSVSRCSERLRPAGCSSTDAVAPPQLHRGVLRHRAARHQRGGVRLDLPSDRRVRRPVLRRRGSSHSAHARARGSASSRRRCWCCSVGALATNVIGKRLLQRTEGYLLHVPVFRTSTRRSSSSSSRFRRTTSTASSASC